jgi:hypothetical protein
MTVGMCGDENPYFLGCEFIEKFIQIYSKSCSNMRRFNKAVVQPALSLCVRKKLWTAAVWQAKDCRL